MEVNGIRIAVVVRVKTNVTKCARTLHRERKMRQNGIYEKKKNQLQYHLNSMVHERFVVDERETN